MTAPLGSVTFLLREATVLLLGNDTELGSGFFVSPDLVLTAAHVVAPATSKLFVRDREGQVHRAELLWCDPRLDSLRAPIYPMPDLAILRVPSAARTEHAVAMLSDQLPTSGDLIAEGYSSAITHDGFQSDTARVYFEGTRPDPDGILIKCSGAAVDSGMSGGPLLDLATGMVVGVTKARRSEDLPTGLYAVSISTLRTRRPDYWTLNQIYHGTDRRWRVAARPGSTVRDPTVAVRTLLDQSRAVIARRRWNLPAAVDREKIHQTVWIRRVTPTDIDRNRPTDQRQKDRTRWAPEKQTNRTTVVRALPGFGKSWLLAFHTEYLASRALKKLMEGQDPLLVRIPLLVDCSTLASVTGAQIDRNAILNIVAGSLDLTMLDREEANECRAMMDEAYDVGRLLFCMDGLDEVPGRLRARLRSSLTTLATSANSIVIASRPSAVALLDDVPLSGRLDVELVGFGHRETTLYVEAWHSGHPALKARLLDALRRSVALRSIATVPLLLSFLCRLAKSDEQFPTTEHALYQRVVERLLSGDWRDTPARAAQSYDSPPDAAARLRLLARSLGALQDTWRGSSSSLTRSDLSAQLRTDPEYDYLHRCSIDRWEAWQNESFTGSARPPSDPVIWELVFDGLLVDEGASEGQPRVRVLHPALRDYLLSVYISSMDQRQLATSLDIHRWFDLEWQAVFALAISGLEDPDALIQEILDVETDPWANQLVFALACVVKCDRRLADETLEALLSAARRFDASSRLSDQRRIAEAVGELVIAQIPEALQMAESVVTGLSEPAPSSDLSLTCTCALAEIGAQAGIERATAILGGTVPRRYRERLVASLALHGDEAGLRAVTELMDTRGRGGDLSAFLSALAPQNDRVFDRSVAFLHDRRLRQNHRLTVAAALLDRGNQGISAVVHAARDIALEWSYRCCLFQLLIDFGVEDDILGDAMTLLRSPNVGPESKSFVIEAALRAGVVDWLSNAMQLLFEPSLQAGRRVALARAIRDIGEEGVDLLRQNLTMGFSFPFLVPLLRVLVEVRDRPALELTTRLIFDGGVRSATRAELALLALSTDPYLIEGQALVELATNVSVSYRLRRDLALIMARASLPETVPVVQRLIYDHRETLPWPDLTQELGLAGRLGRRVLIDMCTDSEASWIARTESIVALSRVEAPELGDVLQRVDTDTFPEMWRNRIYFSLTSTGSGAFVSKVVGYVLIFEGAYDVLYNYMMSPTPADASVFFENAVSIDRARDPKNVEQRALVLDETVLDEIGYKPRSPADGKEMLTFMYSALEQRVGEMLARLMLGPQLDEFERFIDENDEASAMHFLGLEFPEHQSVVRQKFSELKREIASGTLDRPRPESEGSQPSVLRSLELAARVLGELDQARASGRWTRYFEIVAQNVALLRTAYCRQLAQTAIALDSRSYSNEAHMWILIELQSCEVNTVAHIAQSNELLRQRAVHALDDNDIDRCWLCCSFSIVRHGASATSLFYLGMSAAAAGNTLLATKILEDCRKRASAAQVKSALHTIDELRIRFDWTEQVVDELRAAMG